MSADLFEAFGGDTQNHQAPEATSNAPAQGTVTSPYDPAQSSAFLLFSQQTHHHPKPPAVTDGPLWQTSAGGNDVLFDAATDQPDDDEFGDFEDVQALDAQVPKSLPRETDQQPFTTPQSTAPDSSLIDLGFESQPLSEVTHPNTNAESSEWGDFESGTSSSRNVPMTLDVQTDEAAWEPFEAIEESTSRYTYQVSTSPTQKRFRPAAPTPSQRSISKLEPPEDDWDVFEDGQPAAPDPAFPHNEQNPQWQQPWSKSSASKELSSRPTNVPPPALLLSLIPNLTLNLISPSSDPSHTAASIIVLHQTLYRILAGRPLRWRRDTHLAQSTRISAAGKPGGMKLTSLSKDEKMREEREAAEAVEVWNSNLHALSRAVSDAKMSAKGGGLKVSANVGVKELKGPGTLQDRLCCAVCGLKRNERVIGLDEGEDIFGEFWTESWGHTSCEEWWNSAEPLLRRR